MALQRFKVKLFSKIQGIAGIDAQSDLYHPIPPHKRPSLRNIQPEAKNTQTRLKNAWKVRLEVHKQNVPDFLGGT